MSAMDQGPTDRRSTLKPLEGRRSRGGASLVAAAVTVIAIALVAATSDLSGAIRSVLEFGKDRESAVPLLPEGDGSFAFMETEPGKPKVPITYDPCKKIEVVINPDGAPDDYRDLVETAADHVTDASGLEFAIRGTSDERPSKERPAEDRDRYGPGWSPVLVAWSDSDETPELAGDVAGLAGSLMVEVLGNRVYVTGSVTFDGEDFEEILAESDGRAYAQAIVDHEFGHLVGLDHVKDPNELMNARNKGQLSWGPGDLAGLSRLGRGPCIATF